MTTSLPPKAPPEPAEARAVTDRSPILMPPSTLTPPPSRATGGASIVDSGLTSSEQRALLEAKAALAEATDRDPTVRKASAATKLVLAVFGGGGFTWSKASVWIAFLVVVGLSVRTYLDPPMIGSLTKSVGALAQSISRLECVMTRSRDPATAAAADTYCLDRWPMLE